MFYYIDLLEVLCGFKFSLKAESISVKLLCVYLPQEVLIKKWFALKWRKDFLFFSDPTLNLIWFSPFSLLFSFLLVRSHQAFRSVSFIYTTGLKHTACGPKPAHGITLLSVKITKKIRCSIKEFVLVEPLFLGTFATIMYKFYTLTW